MCPPFRSRLGCSGGPAGLPCGVTIPALRSVPLIGAKSTHPGDFMPIPDTTIRDDREHPTCRASWHAMKPRIQCVLTPWKPGSTASGPAPATIDGPAQTPAAIHGRGKLRPRAMAGPDPAAMLGRGHFRLSGRSWERRRPASEAGISKTTVESSSGELAFAGAGRFAGPAGALAAAVVPLATVGSSGAPPSDHGRAGSHGGPPLAAGWAAGSAARPAPGAASGARAGARGAACAAARAASRAASRSRPRALPRGGTGAGAGSAT